MRRTRGGRVVLLGLDPALRTFGYALVGVVAGVVVPLALGVVTTTNDRAMSKSESNLVSGKTLFDRLDALVGVEAVDAICAEAMSYPPGAASAARISICWGVIASVSELRGVPVRQASPQAIRRALGVPPRAEKVEVHAELMRRVDPRAVYRRLSGTPRDLHEHALDALAAAVALVAA